MLHHAVDAVSQLQAVDRILTRASDTHPGAYVCLTNVNTVVLSQTNRELRSAVDSAFMSVPDGMPLVWILRQQGHAGTEKLAGADLMSLLATAGRDLGLRHFVYAWTSGLALAAANGLRRKAPEALVVGTDSPPFARRGGFDAATTPPWIELGSSVAEADWELERLQACVKRSRPHVLWVGLGSPIQDQWMSMVAAHLDVPVMIGVGRALSYIAGTRRRCPSFMVNSGLEWAWTLASEPRRLWRRYLVGNSRFLYLVARAELAEAEPYRGAGSGP